MEWAFGFQAKDKAEARDKLGEQSLPETIKAAFLASIDAQPGDQALDVNSAGNVSGGDVDIATFHVCRIAEVTIA